MATAMAAESIERITRATDARELATWVYDRMLELLEQLQPDDWEARTECPAWDVADMVGHLIGAAKGHASTRELVRQQLWAALHRRARNGNRLDAMNALQVADHDHLTPPKGVAALRVIAPAAVEGRMDLPGPLRRVRVVTTSPSSCS